MYQDTVFQQQHSTNLKAGKDMVERIYVSTIAVETFYFIFTVYKFVQYNLYLQPYLWKLGCSGTLKSQTLR